MCMICAGLRPQTPTCDYEGLTSRPIYAVFTEGRDLPNDVTTSVTINPGDTFNGTYSSGIDRDAVAVNLVAGQSYRITLDGIDTGSGTPDPFLFILDRNGVTIASDDDAGAGLNSLLNFTATETGTYYLSAGQYGSGRPGGYSLSISSGTEPPPPGGTVATVADMARQLTTDYWELEGQRSFDVRAGGTISVNLTGLTADGQRLATDALAVWTAVSGINFSVTSGSAQITFDDNDSGAYATSQLTISGRNIITSSFVNVSTQWLANNGTGLTSYSFQTYLHEIGHALGLGHAGNYNGNATYGLSERYRNDSWQISVMSYFSQSDNTSLAATYASVITPMVADILAIQNLYGTSTTLRSGNTVYGENSNAGGVFDQFSRINTDADGLETVTMTVVDSGGIDTLDFRSGTNGQRIDLRGSQVSDVYGHLGTLVLAAGTVIENALTGSGNDSITGNDAANQIDSFAGNDLVNAGLGNDTLNGGFGFDSLNGEAGNDSLNGGGQADALSGGDGNDTLSGEQGFDVVSGNAGNDSLFGGTEEDWMFGGIDNDVVNGGDGNDFLFGGLGFDTINGDSGNDRITGEGQADALYGGAGNDTQLGEQGFDIVSGGAGNDSLFGGTEEDWMFGGIDNDRVEGGDGNDFLFGGLGFDTLLGGTGNDRLTGEGNADELTGGSGNDTLQGGDGADRFVFNAGPGQDRIEDFAVSVAGEVIALVGLSGFGSFAEVQAALTIGGGNSVISFGNGHSLTVAGVTTLAADDFVFA